MSDATKTIHLTLEPVTAKKLERLATADRRTPTAWCRKVLLDAIESTPLLPAKARRE